MSTKETGRDPVWAGAVLAVAAVAAVPFVLGAVLLAMRASRLPSVAGQLAFARSLGAAAFVFGLATGLVASVYALVSRSPERRALGTAGVLLGCSQLALGVILRKTIEHEAVGTAGSLVPIAVPIALWGVSAWIAIGAARKMSGKPSLPAESANEEQPQLLSPP